MEKANMSFSELCTKMAGLGETNRESILAIARDLKIEVPFEEGFSIKENYLGAKAKKGAVGRDYVIVPPLTLADDTATREMWVRQEAYPDVTLGMLKFGLDSGRITAGDVSDLLGAE